MIYEEMAIQLEDARRTIEIQEIQIAYQEQTIGYLRASERKARYLSADERWCCVLLGAFGAAAVMMVGFLLTRIF